MKQPRTIRIFRLISSVTTSTLRGDKLVLNQTTEGLEKLGGIYIKFLQMVVLSLDPFSQSGYKKLLEVYEKSTPDNINVYDYLRRELSADKMAMIKTVEPLPFATGSFGQVYRAQLQSGEAVIIKVLRPSVKRYLRYDLRLIGAMCWLYSAFDRQKMLNFRDIFADFKRISLQETDYVREAAIAHQYYESYKDHPNLITPKTYLELCSRNVLVQELISGVSVANILDLQLNGADAVTYCQQYLNTDLYKMMQTVGVELLQRAIAGEIMQSDPHPGNIILLPNNKVALIDFGMSTQVVKNRQSLYELVLEYRNFYSGNLSMENFTLVSLKFLAPELYAAISQADTIFGIDGGQEAIMDKIRLAITEIVNDRDNKVFIDQLMSRRQIMKVLFFAINRNNRFGFNFDLSSSALLKAIQGYFVLMGRLDPSGRVVRDMLDDVVNRSSMNLDAVMSSPATTVTPPQALETLSCWFDKMARNDPWLMDRLIGSYIE